MDSEHEKVLCIKSLGNITLNEAEARASYSSSRANSLPSTSTKSNTNCKEELIGYFYNSMLNCIVDTSQTHVKTSADSIVSGGRTVIPRKNYKPACSSSEILKEEYFEEELGEDIMEVAKIFEKRSMVFKPPSQEETERKSKLVKIRSKCSATNSSLRLRRGKRSGQKSEEIKKSYIDFLRVKKPTINIEFNEDAEDHVKVVFLNGNVYEGPLLKKRFHGIGKFFWADGCSYIGDFKNGELTGKGCLKYVDQSVYEGEFITGMRHGHGTCYPPKSSSFYRGEWFADMKQGQGWILFEPNNWYEGSWQNDVMEGYGLRYYASGARYQGEWKNGKRHGYGSAIMSNHDFYIGEWFENKRQGYGQYVWKSFLNKTLTSPVQHEYSGEWVDDQMHGIGVMNFGTKGGARYVGSFKNNLKHGAGHVILDNGAIIEADPLFIDDKPVHVEEDPNVSPLPGTSTASDDSSPFLIKDRSYKKLHDSQGEILPSKFNRILSTYKFETKEFKVPSSNLSREILANYNIYDLVFPPIKKEYSSFRIPIHTESEKIDLKLYIDQIEIKMKNSLDAFMENCKYIEDPEPRNWKSYYSPEKKKQIKMYDLSKLRESEDTTTRAIICKHLGQLHNIYKHYSNVAVLRKLPFDTIMLRIFLWQLYRDCQIYKRGTAIHDTDILMAGYTKVTGTVSHYPFERIYFWQYLHSLLGLAWKYYADEYCSFKMDNDTGILATIFEKFLENDIYPLAKHHVGCVLFDYRDLIPLDSVYAWYEALEGPFTALEFVKLIFDTIPVKNYERRKTCTFIDENSPTVPIGLNTMTICDKLCFLTDDPPSTIRPTERKFEDNYDKSKSLSFLQHLGPKGVVNVIREVCPSTEDSMDYILTFLEFYEIVLSCTQIIIDQQEAENRKKKEKKVAYVVPEVFSAESIKSTKVTKKRKKSRPTP